VFDELLKNQRRRFGDEHMGGSSAPWSIGQEGDGGRRLPQGKRSQDELASAPIWDHGRAIAERADPIYCVVRAGAMTMP
jgi:hypothetical protein